MMENRLKKKLIQPNNTSLRSNAIRNNNVFVVVNGIRRLIIYIYLYTRRVAFVGKSQ